MSEGEELVQVYNNSNVHGLGVVPISSYAEDAAFKEACEFALEDLNTNLFMSVYIEEFKSNEFTTYNFPELSIQDTVLNYGPSVVKADSFALGGQAYCVAESQGISSINSAMPPAEELMISPQRSGNYWFAIGKAPATRFNPSIAWMRAKNDAIQDLTKVLRTSVQSRVLRFDEGTRDQMEEITYFKSNLIYNNIYNVRRYVTSKSFVTVIAVRQNEVIEY